MEKETEGKNLGWGIWAFFTLVLCLLVGATPGSHTVTHAYRHAALAWSAHEDLYEFTCIHGFLYLPQAAIAFLPITWLPLALGEILWRLPGIAFLAWGVWELSGRIEKLAASFRPQGDWFFLLTLVLLPSLFSSARNGQTNLPLAACALWISLAVIDRRWNRALLLLLLSLVLKPIAVVPILLFAALYPPLRLRLAGGIAALLLLPFLNPDWNYVRHQYALCWQKMTLARQPMERGFCDFSGMIWTFTGHPMPQEWIQGLGIAMALATFALAWTAARKDPRFAPFWITGLSAAYLMLFNPRTEANSYVILGAALLVFVGDAAGRESRIEKIALIVGAVALGSDSFGYPIFPWTHLWLKALLALGFLAYLVVRLTKGRYLFAAARQSGR